MTGSYGLLRSEYVARFLAVWDALRAPYATKYGPKSVLGSLNTTANLDDVWSEADEGITPEAAAKRDFEIALNCLGETKGRAA